MMKKYLSFILCCLLLTTANSTLISAQTRADNDAANIAKIKADVAKRGTGENKRVKVVRRDGTKLRGFISQVSEDSFTLTDSKTRQNNSIAYRDVKRLQKSGYSKGDKIVLGIIIGAAATVAVVLGTIIGIRCKNEGGC